MKYNMSTLVIILLVAGIAYLAIYHKPHNHSEAELKKWFNSKLSDIADNLESDIKKDKEGEYVHAGKQSFEKRGAINYILRDKNHARFEISDKNNISVKDIMATDGYHKLDAKARDLNLSIRLEEKYVEGDGVETFNELDEYIDDFPRYYTVTISGW
jgi:Cft2 family RNA processing exonuclease